MGSIVQSFDAYNDMEVQMWGRVVRREVSESIVEEVREISKEV